MSNTNQGASLIARIAQRFGVDPAKLYDTLKTTCFRKRDGTAPTHEQMMALLIVSDQYGLNPFTKEIVAFEGQGGQIVPVVSVDGWSRIINENPMFDGVEFRYGDNMVTMSGAQPCPDKMECHIYRKDRSRPVIIPEWLDEVYVPQRGKFHGPWQTHTKRMLRHKALIQCARVAVGFTGIYDADEASRILAGDVVARQSRMPAAAPQQSIQDLDQQIGMLRIRAEQVGVDTLEAFIRDRFKGSDLDYVLAGVKAPAVPVMADADVIPDEPEMAHPVEDTNWDHENFY